MAIYSFRSVYQKHATCFLRLWARWCLLYVTHPLVGKNTIVIRSYSQKNFPLQKNEGLRLFPVTVNRSFMLDICRSLKFYFKLIHLCSFTVSSKVGYKIKRTQLQVFSELQHILMAINNFFYILTNWQLIGDFRMVRYRAREEPSCFFVLKIFISIWMTLHKFNQKFHLLVTFYLEIRLGIQGISCNTVLPINGAAEVACLKSERNTKNTLNILSTQG